MQRKSCCCKNNYIEEKCEKVKDIYNDTCCDVPNTFQNNYNSCECGFEDEGLFFPDNPMFGQSYVPWQTMNKTFSPEVGLKMGTIFPELVDPYLPGQSEREIKYLESRNEIGKGCNR